MNQIKTYLFFISPLFVLCLISLPTFAQPDAELKNKEINVAADGVTFLQFKDEIEFYEWEQKESYTVRKRGKSDITIAVNVEDPKRAKLRITEGGRTHTFLLVLISDYDPNKQQLEYDFRDVKVLKKLAKENKAGGPGSDEPKVVDNTPPPPPVVDNEKVKQAAAAAAAAKQEEEQNKQMNDRYNAAIAKADKDFKNKAYTNAKAGYYAALGIKPTEKYPSDQLAKINAAETAAADAAARENEVDAKFGEALVKGDNAFGSKSYYLARVSYADALKLKPNDPTARTKLADTDAAIAKIAAEAAQAREINDKYNVAIAKGDKAFKERKFDDAKAAYYTAMGLKSEEKYPMDKLAEIEQIVTANTAAIEEMKARAFKKEQDDNYNAAIARADRAFKANNFDAAGAAYTEALQAKPGESYPANQLVNIETRKNELATRKAEEADRLMKEKAINDSYNSTLATADMAFTSKDYEAAKAGYYAALEFKPNEDYPKRKLAAIEKALIDKALAEKEAEERERYRQYQTVVQDADKAFGVNDFAIAESKYKDAQAIVPDNPYPAKQLASIVRIRAEKAERERKAEERRKDSTFYSLVAQADDAFNKKNYDDAKKLYKGALDEKPDNEYAKKRFAIANSPKEIKYIADKEKLDQYKQVLDAADNAYANKDFAQAKALYTEAIGYRPSEMYPKHKLEITKVALVEKEKADREREKVEKYQAIIARGDKAFNAGQYEDAKASYYEAVGINPADNYPAQKIVSADEKLAEIQKRIAKQKEDDMKYAAALKSADSALAAGSVEEAKASYQVAFDLRPNEAYPKAKLAGINKAAKNGKKTPKPATPAKQEEAVIKTGKVTEPAKPVAVKTNVITKQLVPIPYNQAQLFNKYPEIDFSMMPGGQKTTADYFISEDTLKNFNVSKNVLKEQPRLSFSDSSNGIVITLESIGFSGTNAYLKLTVKNYSSKEFLVGKMGLNWTKKDNSTIGLNPCYVSSYPVVQMGKQVSFVYACRAANANDKDNFSFTMSSRISDDAFQLSFNGETYNQEMSR